MERDTSRCVDRCADCNAAPYWRSRWPTQINIDADTGTGTGIGTEHLLKCRACDNARGAVAKAAVGKRQRSSGKSCSIAVAKAAV